MPAIRPLHLFGAIGAALLASPVAAQKYTTGGALNSCVERMYTDMSFNVATQGGVLSFRNRCNQRISITYCAIGGSDGCFETDVSPGRIGQTQYNRREERDAGGVIAYPCPDGYLPVDSNDDNVRGGPAIRYRCKSL